MRGKPMGFFCSTLGSYQEWDNSEGDLGVRLNLELEAREWNP